MDSPTKDVKPPPWGPAFLKLSAWPYRAEMAVLTLALAVLLSYWRLIVVGDLDVLATLFWILRPDLASFLPIGLAMRGGTSWPGWGPSLYNVFHTFLVWAPVFGL